MSGDDAVTDPSRESGPSQVAGLIRKPGHIPPVGAQWDPYHIHLDLQRRDLQPQISVRAVGFLRRLEWNGRPASWREAGFGSLER